MSQAVPPLHRLLPFHRVLFSSPSSLSSSSSTPAFFSSSGVQMYSRCITLVLWMTERAAILTLRCAEWIGKYRAVEEWSIHPSAFTPVAVRVLTEKRLFLPPKCTLHLQKRTLINFRWITTGECGGARSGGRSEVKKQTKKQRVETQQGGRRQSTGEAYVDEVKKLVLWSCYTCGPTPCLCSAPVWSAHLFLNLIIPRFPTPVNTHRLSAKVHTTDP